MKFAGFLGRTFLVHAAVGAGSALGIGAGILATFCVGSKLGFKTSAEVVENEEKKDEAAK